MITGASSGIGAATARAVARQGMSVVLAARRLDRLHSLASEIRAMGGKASVVAHDCAVPGSEVALLDAAEREFGALDVVFANAGYGLDRPMHLLGGSDLRAMFEVNFFAGCDLLTESARRLLAAKRTGHLLMCSSCVGRYALPGYGAYAATKAAQTMVCQSMRFELKTAGIAVSSVHPIATTTEFFEQCQRRAGLEKEASHPEHAPKMFVQPAERVAEAIVACLKRPRAEVWTSWSARLAGAVFALSPWLHWRAIRSMIHRD